MERRRQANHHAAAKHLEEAEADLEANLVDLVDLADLAEADLAEVDLAEVDLVDLRVCLLSC